jgi:hypothetical protein
MGYAYSLGMIEKISEAGFKMGRFYIVAPENACSGEINLKNFEEVWQFGSNEANDLIWEQDGVAPQCPVKGLRPNPGTADLQGRIYIPSGDPNRDFLAAHSISSYEWIFTTLTIGRPGYVKERK